MGWLPMFLTVDELAAVLRCQPEKVYRLAARGELPSYKVEGRRLFDQDEVARGSTRQRDGPRFGNGARGGRRVASIRPYRTANGQRRYKVRYRDGDGRQRSSAFSAHKDAQAFKVDVERRQQAGLLYRATPSASARLEGVARALRARRRRPGPAAAGHRRHAPRDLREARTARRPAARAHPRAAGRGHDGRARRQDAAARRDGARAPQAHPRAAPRSAARPSTRPSSTFASPGPRSASRAS